MELFMINPNNNILAGSFLMTYNLQSNNLMQLTLTNTIKKKHNSMKEAPFTSDWKVKATMPIWTI